MAGHTECDTGRAGRDRRSVEVAELAMTLPGGQWKKRGVQQLLLRVISYIQFLQHRIQKTQSRLIPHNSRQGFLPLWTPRHSVNITCKRTSAHPRVRKRWRPRGSEIKPKVKSERIWRQRLVPYVSSSSSENGDGSPWLVPVSPGSPHTPCTPQSLSAVPLELSPLLLYPPADGLPQALFGEVEILSWSSDDFQDPAAATALSLDHSYQSWPPQQTKESDVVAECPEHRQKPPGEAASGSGLIQRRRIQVHGARSRARRGQVRSSSSKDGGNSAHSAGVTPRPCTSSRLQQLRKKCVNGFIMFCRLNRRPYLSAHPGKASTAATKDLAELWRVMSARERRPYCIRALQFSLLHDRLVRSSSSGLPHENVSPPKPVSVLLAEKAALSKELEEF